MNKLIYFWKDGELHEYFGRNDPESVHYANFNNCFCLDASCQAENLRYGKYTGAGWRHFPPEQFPKEFRMNLLLLGVT